MSSFIDRLKSLRLRQAEKETVKVSWLGLQEAGKTTILKRITTGLFDSRSVRTLGMNVEEFHSDEIRLLCWDIGGQETFRSTLWESYIEGSLGIIFVVDSSNFLSFDEARDELWRYVLRNPKCHKIPVLILANKQDIPTAASAGIVARRLDLHKVIDRSYAIVPTSAKTGFNIEEALEWLRQRIVVNISK